MDAKRKHVASAISSKKWVGEQVSYWGRIVGPDCFPRRVGNVDGQLWFVGRTVRVGVKAAADMVEEFADGRCSR